MQQSRRARQPPTSAGSAVHGGDWFMDCAELSACAGFDEAARLLRERPYDLFLMPFAIRGADASTAREKICALRANSGPAMIGL